MSIDVGNPRSECPTNSSIHSLRKMWWVNVVGPVLYNPQSLYAPTTVVDDYDFDAVMDCGGLGPHLSRPQDNISEGFTTYKTNYIDEYFGASGFFGYVDTTAYGGHPALAHPERIVQSTFINMPKSDARLLVNEIAERMSYVVNYYVEAINAGTINDWAVRSANPAPLSARAEGYAHGAPERFLVSQNRYQDFHFWGRSGGDQWLTLGEAIEDIQRFYLYFRLQRAAGTGTTTSPRGDVTETQHLDGPAAAEPLLHTHLAACSVFSGARESWRPFVCAMPGGTLSSLLAGTLCGEERSGAAALVPLFFNGNNGMDLTGPLSSQDIVVAGGWSGFLMPYGSAYEGDLAISGDPPTAARFYEYICTHPMKPPYFTYREYTHVGCCPGSTMPSGFVGTYPDSDGDGVPDVSDSDADGDGVPDEPAPPPPGDDVDLTAAPLCPEPERPPEMPSCVSDPTGFTTDWSVSDEPFLNSTNCQYYIPVTTEYDCPGADELPNRVYEFINPAALASLVGLLDKDLEADPEGPLKGNILEAYIHERGADLAYEWEKSPRDKLRVLYKWPFYLVSALQLLDNISAPTPSTGGTPTYMSSISGEGLLDNLSQLKKKLKRFTYQQIIASMPGAAHDQLFKLVVDATSLEVNLKSEVDLVQKLKGALNQAVQKNNFKFPDNAPGRSPISRSPIALPNEKKIIEELLIEFDGNYQFVALYAKPRDAGFKRLSVGDLPADSPLKNPTMVSYLANLRQIASAILTVEGFTLETLIDEYHYPPLRKVDIATQDNSLTCHPGEALGAAIASEAQSIVMQELTSLLGNLASDFKKYGCMDPQTKEERDTKLKNSWGTFAETLKSQTLGELSSADGIIGDLDKIIKQIEGADVKGMEAAWEGLFNKLTACGMANQIVNTITKVAKTDACGISAEQLLQTLVKQVLKNAPVKSLEDLWKLLDGGIQTLVHGEYEDRAQAVLSDAGYTGGSALPWQFTQALEDEENRALRGINFYNSSPFQVGRNRAGNDEDPNLTAFLQGYDYLFKPYDDGMMSEAEEYSFWLGFIAATTEIITTGARLGAPAFERPAFLSSASARSRVETRAATAINAEFIDLVIMHTDIDELLEMIKSLPVIGPVLMALLAASAQVTKCIINGNINDLFGEGIDVLQNNLKALASDGEVDFCAFMGLKPITKPDIERLIKKNVNTLWSAIKDTIIDAVMTLLQNLILKLTLKILKLVVSGFQGGLCDRPGILSQAIQGQLPETLRGTFDLVSSFEDALCGEVPSETASIVHQDFVDGAAYDPSSATAEARLIGMVGSMTGVDPELAAEIINGENNIIDALSQRLRPDQLLDLLEGTPTDGVLQTVLSLIAATNPELAAILTDATAVRNFFLQLGDLFPPGYLDNLRRGLALTSDDDVIQTICDLGPEQARLNLGNTLREECGDQITEDQIQEQLDRFEQRALEVMENLASALAGGMDGATEDTFRSAIEANLPEDDPANLFIAEEIASIMFDPLYVTYANDLMAPMDPEHNGGFLNLVLSNINAVPQRGQIGNYRATVGFLTSLIAGILPFPALTAEVAADIAEGLEPKWFGDGGPSSNGPPGWPAPDQVRLKPATVAHHLQTIFEQFTLPDSVEYTQTTTGFNLVFMRPRPATPAAAEFTISYNAVAGAVTLSYGDTSLMQENVQMQLISNFDAALENFPPSSTTTLMATLDAYLGADGVRNTENVGTALLVSAAANAGLSAISESDFEAAAFADYDTLRQGMRESFVKMITQKVAQNHLSFDYGEYHLEELSAEMLLGAAPPPEGYTVVNLPDGRISIIPPEKGGWLQVKDILFDTASDEFCCDDQPSGNLFDMELIRNNVVESYKNAVEDPRLDYNPRHVAQPPYSRILNRMNLATMEGVVTTTIKTYIIEYFLRGLATFTRFKPSYGVFGDVLAQYMANKMKTGLRSQRPRPAAPAYPRGSANEDDKLYAYWYEFLEQACQVVSRRVKEGRLYISSPEFSAAMARIQTAIEGYQYPDLGDVRAERASRGNPFITLKNFRQKDKIDFIQETESSAMIVLKYLIIDELNDLASRVGDIFPTPPAIMGINWWISDYAQLMESMFFKHEFIPGGPYSNIFDVRRINEDDGALEPTLPFLAHDQAGSALLNGTFILESYVRATPSIAYEEAVVSTYFGGTIPLIAPDRIFGLGEFKDILALIVERTSVQDTTLLSQLFDEIKYGLRVTYVLPQDTADFSGLTDAMASTPPDTTNRLFYGNGHAVLSEDYPPGTYGAYTTPAVYDEAFEEPFSPLGSTTFGDFNGLVATTESGYFGRTRNTETFNWQSLWQRILNSHQSRMLYDYSLQVQNIASILSIYNIEAFLKSVGIDDEWNVGMPRPPNNYIPWNQASFKKLRRQLKRIFKEVYNSQDFTYREDPLGAEEARDVRNTRRETDVSRTTSGADIPPGITDRIIFAPITCDDDDEGET